MTDHRALCAEILKTLDDYEDGLRVDWDDWRARARTALSQPERQIPTRDEVVALYSEVMAVHECQTLGEPAEHFSHAVLARWDATRLSRGSADEELPPRVGHILKLTEIIREVDGNHDKGAAALAEAILSHPGSRWSPTVKPEPTATEAVNDTI